MIIKNSQEFRRNFLNAFMSLETQVIYEFDNFRLNPANHSLLCRGKAVPLTPKSFEILVTSLSAKACSSPRRVDEEDLA